MSIGARIAGVIIGIFWWVLIPSLVVQAEQPIGWVSGGKYTRTALPEDVTMLLDRLAASGAPFERLELGRSLEGRPLLALAIGDPDSPLTVMVIGGIHAGEPAGKEALLRMLEGWSARGLPTEWQGRLRIIVLPDLNPDGNARRSPEYRSTQPTIGGDWGARENAQGLDLNRDFTKLESPEIQALVKAIDQHSVDVLIDTHTTNGTLHAFELTYEGNQNPAAPAAAAAWLRDHLLPRVDARLAEAGYQSFFYGNLDATQQRWEAFDDRPRLAYEYMGLRGKLGILVEAFSYLDFDAQVDVSQRFVEAAMTELAEHAEHVASLTDTEPTPDEPLALTSRMEAWPEPVDVTVYEVPEDQRSQPLVEQFRNPQRVAKTYRVQHYGRFTPVNEVRLPQAYAFPAEQSGLARRLLQHGIQVQRMAEPRTVDVERLGVLKVQRADEEFQGHRLVTLETQARLEQATLPAGTFVVPVAQPLGRLAAILLDPMSNDGLTAWNALDAELQEGADHPVLRVRAPVDSLAASEVLQVPPLQRLKLDKLPSASRAGAPGGRNRASWLSDGRLAIRKGDGWYVLNEGVQGGLVRLELHKEVSAALQPLAELDEGKRRALANEWIVQLIDGDPHAMSGLGNDLYVYHRDTKSVQRVTGSAENPRELSQLSPDGRTIAFVRNGDLFVVDVEKGQERKLTEGGSADVLHGKLDWVYQEEIYGRGNYRAFWFSPDGARIAFLRVDQTPVQRYQVSDSTSVRQTLEDARYPKAGDPIPVATLHVVELTSGVITPVTCSEDSADEERIIARVTWNKIDGSLTYQVQNRRQTWLELRRVDMATGNSQRILRDEAGKWVEILGEPRFLADGRFLWLHDTPEGRRHLDVVQPDGTRQPVTRGSWDVDKVARVVDGVQPVVFLTSRNRAGLGQEHAYRVRVPAAGQPPANVVQVTRGEGTHSISVSSTGQALLDSHSSLGMPSKSWVWTVGEDGSLERQQFIDGTLESPLRDYAIRTPQLLRIPSADPQVSLPAMLFTPVDLDLEQPDRQLPVLIHSYGGPQAPLVSDAWLAGGGAWHQYLAQEGVAVLVVDNRSQAGRGIADTWPIYGDMGRRELADLEAAISWLEQQPWADASRVGLWGWSYGGYQTAYALTHSRRFKCGIAGAPVTDWHNYDAFYTERYMNLPQENAEGYRVSSAVQAAEQLHGRLLLLHGEMDDNVHISNTLQMAQALQDAGKQFDLMIYPKNRHGVVDPEQRRHMQQLMTDFVMRYLK